MNPASDMVQEHRRAELQAAFVAANPCTTRQDWNEETCAGCEYNRVCPRVNDDEFREFHGVA